MDGLVELRALVGNENPTATAIMDNIQQTMDANAGKYAALEQSNTNLSNDLTETIQGRDKIKGIIKAQLGIEEFTEDAIKNKLSAYGNEDALAARDSQFNELKAASATSIQELETKLANSATEMNNMKLKLAIAGTDVMGQTRGEHANEMLLQWIAQDAVFDDQGNITYKGQGGETLMNANHNPLTLDDRINEIKADQSRDFVFQDQYLKGGGAPAGRTVVGPGGSSDGGAFTRSTMSFNEKKDYRAKYGEEAYQQLPLV